MGSPQDVYNKFMELCRTDEPFMNEKITERLARAIHGSFLDLANKDPEVTVDAYVKKNFKSLTDDAKSSNIGAAQRIPVVLAVAGMKVRKIDPATQYPADYDDQIRDHIEHHIEIMSELEHDLWCEERRSNGWRYGRERDNDRRIHTLLKPYSELDDKDQEKDRNQVRNYPKFLRKVGYRIVFSDK